MDSDRTRGGGPDIRDQPCVTVAIPLYNEEETVAELLRRVSEVLAGVPGDCHQIVCVDDGSSDGTLDRLLVARTALGGSVNSAAARYFDLETRLAKSRRNFLPFGTSVVAVARRPA